MTNFIIRYNSFSCNLDHDGKTVYLHALPSNQSPLFHWASIVEQTVESYNVTINHPRKSKFHMTLARVTPEYPTDKAVELLKNYNVPYDELIFGKPYADIYIDDKGMSLEELEKWANSI